MELHAISASEYAEMKADYFGTNPPADAWVSATSLDLSVDCAEYAVVTYANFNSTTSNAELQPAVVADAYTSTSFINRRFSVALFRGINRQFSPDTYFFSKGSSASGRGILLRAVKDNGDVYFADVSDRFP